MPISAATNIINSRRQNPTNVLCRKNNGSVKVQDSPIQRLRGITVFSCKIYSQYTTDLISSSTDHEGNSHDIKYIFFHLVWCLILLCS